LLSVAAGIFWLVGAVLILVREKIPGAVVDVLAFTLRFQFQLVAYHLSLVDAYPSVRTAKAVPAT
jgi:hypothetical protein